MTTGTVRTKGTRLFFTDPLSASSSDADGVVIHKVSCPTGVQGLGGAADSIDTTCLDSVEREYLTGMPNPGQVTIPINLIPASASHQALLALKESGDQVSWMVVLSDQAASPSAIVSDQILDATRRMSASLPTGRTVSLAAACLRMTRLCGSAFRA